MEHSESLVNLAAALAKAQGSMENPHKNATNPQVRKKYADLAEVINTVRPALAEHGLSVVQFPGFDGERVTLQNVLLHESGEWLADTASAPIGIQYAEGGRVLPPSPQAVGMSITYLRRYSLAAICGVAQEDDDANSARSNGTGATSENGASATTPTPTCPKCDGAMWDNREGKTNPNAPDFKCKDKECGKNGGVYWPGEWPPVGEATEEAEAMDQRAHAAQLIVNEISGMDAEQGDLCQKLLDEKIKQEGVTAADLIKLGSSLQARLKKLQAAAAAATAGVGAGEDDDDLPFK